MNIKNTIISVVMPVRLSNYDGCATNRETKFIEAVESFKNQTYPFCNLFIVADNEIDEVKAVYDKCGWAKLKNIHLIGTETVELYEGKVRQVGIEYARDFIGNSNHHFIAYLDSDDLIGATHLEKINEGISKSKKRFFVFENIIGRPPFFSSIIRRKVSINFGQIGTSNICHCANITSSWMGKNGYGHDWEFIKELNHELNHTEIRGTSYFVRHIPNYIDV